MKKNLKKQITIIGGGITGLITAYIAAKAGWKTTVIEASPHIGGLLNTFPIGRNKLEFYYHHFFTHDAELRWLVKELDIEDKLVFRKGSMGVYKNSKLYDFNGPVDILKFEPLNFFDKARFGFSSLYLGKIANWRKMEHIPAMEWFYKYAGKNVTKCIWKPLLEVKFGPYADQIPIAWMVGRLAQRMNSRKQTEEKLGYLTGSLQTLLDALLVKMEKMDVKFVTKAKVTKLHVKDNKLEGITTEQGTFKEGVFVSTIPTIHFAPLVKEIDTQYAEELAKIKYFGAVCTILETDKNFSNTYWINVADSGYPFGGVIEHTNLIPPEEYNNTHITYLSRYFAHSDKLAKMNNEEIQKIMIPPLLKMFPHMSKKNIKNVHVFKTFTAATVCDLNFSEKVPNCTSPIQNLFIASMPHIYPDERSCNNSIRVAAEACKVMGIDSSYIPKNASLSGQIGMK